MARRAKDVRPQLAFIFTTRGFTHARFDGPGRGAPPNDVVDTTGEAVRDDELPPPSP